MATNNIIKISDLDVLTNINGSEELTVSYLTPHKIVSSWDVTYIGTYQYIYNETTKQYDYSYVISGSVKTPKTYRIDASTFESYKFPISMINGGNISSVVTDYAENSYHYVSDICGNYVKINDTYSKIDYTKYTDEELLTLDRYTLKDIDFEYVSNQYGDHVKIGNEYLKYDEAYISAFNSYIAYAQTYQEVYVLPTEENGYQGYYTYPKYLDEYAYIGNIVKYNNAYVSKSYMLNIIQNDILKDKYNVSGVNTITLNFDNNTSFSIKTINGSTGIQGEQGWLGADGETGESAFTYYPNANLKGAYTIVTDTISSYNITYAISSALFGYNTNVELSQYKEVFTTDANYASIIDKADDTNYYTFEENGNITTGKTYNISKFIKEDNKPVIIPDDNIDSSDDSNSNNGIDIELQPNNTTVLNPEYNYND